MRDLVPLMKVNMKITVKKVDRKGSRPNKTIHSYWDSLPCDGVEKKSQDLPVHPCVLRMWKELFDRDNHTPLHKLMVAVNRGSSSLARKKQLTKKELVESVDESIVKLDNEMIRI
jgi:hypothetical protein